MMHQRAMMIRFHAKGRFFAGIIVYFYLRIP